MRMPALVRLVPPVLALVLAVAGPGRATLDGTPLDSTRLNSAARRSAALGAQAGGRERTLFVSAVDPKGHPVEGLGPEDFVVREDGARREVLRSSRALEPIDIAVLVDNSGASGDVIPRIREGLKAFIASMAPQNAIAIVGLAERPTIIVDYTSDRKRLTDGVGRLFTQSASGLTFLDAVVEVSKGMEKRGAARAVVVPILTDGTEFTSHYQGDVIKALTRAGAGLHAITVGTFPVSNDEATRDRAYVLDQGGRVTGGQWMRLLTASAIDPTLQQLARQLSSQYKVVYSRPDSLIPPEKLEIKAGRPGVTMRGTPARGQSTGT